MGLGATATCFNIFSQHVSICPGFPQLFSGYPCTLFEGSLVCFRGFQQCVSGSLRSLFWGYPQQVSVLISEEMSDFRCGTTGSQGCM